MGFAFESAKVHLSYRREEDGEIKTSSQPLSDVPLTDVLRVLDIALANAEAACRDRRERVERALDEERWTDAKNEIDRLASWRTALPLTREAVEAISVEVGREPA